VSARVSAAGAAQCVIFSILIDSTSSELGKQDRNSAYHSPTSLNLSIGVDPAAPATASQTKASRQLDHLELDRQLFIRQPTSHHVKSICHYDTLRKRGGIYRHSLLLCDNPVQFSFVAGLASGVSQGRMRQVFIRFMDFIVKNE
jgi:hypothetical protein